MNKRKNTKLRAWKSLLGLAALLAVLHQNMPVSAEGAVGTIEESGIVAEIRTDQKEYQSGEEIHFSITVTNQKTNCNIDSFSIKYTNTDGLEALSENSLPKNFPIIRFGESASVEGVLVGSKEIFGEAKMENAEGASIVLVIGIIAAAIVVCVLLCIIFKKKKGGKKAKLLLFLPLLLSSTWYGNHITIQAADYETVTLRPYVKFLYGSQEVMIRCVLDLHVYQERSKIPTEYVQNTATICCHDPSIFADRDGSYYIFGSFLAGGHSTDLRNWTSIDSKFQGSFTQEVKDQIRAWNEDSKAGNWNSYLWAPDIIYNESMQKYCMYLSADGDDWKSNIVLLTADKPDGPYSYVDSIVYSGFSESDYAETDAGRVIGEDVIPQRYLTNGVKNKKWGDEYPNCIDPCVFFDEDGNLWMSYGSWSGGIFMLQLDEETGLRDYSISYELNEHSDPYFGKKIAGGKYVSGEASYIQQIGDYYYLFVSYGNLEAKGGYNIRVFRSDKPDGDYFDALGNSPLYDSYVFNYNQSVGVRLFGGYKWRTFSNGQVAQGHNSAFVDDNGKAYIVFHTRTTDGSEGHYVKVHQLFVNKEGWLVAAPYQTSGETLKTEGVPKQKAVGDYEVIIHKMDLDYANLETNKPMNITLKEDGTVTGDCKGTWKLEEGTPYVTFAIDGVNYSGVMFFMNIENSTLEVPVFTALGLENQITIWGSKSFQ